MNASNINWKFKLGDFVTPIVHDDCQHKTKMVITARVLVEYRDHFVAEYICSHYKLGDYVRQQLLESELSDWKATK